MGSTDGWISSCGGARVRAALCLATAFCITAASASVPVMTGATAKTAPPKPSSSKAAPQRAARHRTALRFPAAKIRGHVVTFKLAGLAPTSIRRAFVREGGRTRRLTLHRARAAARRGWLRLHLKRVRAGRYTHAAVRRHKRRKPTLVVIATPPPPAPAPTT